MPYCSTHGFQQGLHCSQCGAPLSETPPAGDSIRVRSPEATAIVNFAPESRTQSRPAEVECPRCGHFNAVRNTFNCKGACEKQNLCRRHFDQEYEVCKWCADEKRGIAKAEAERQAKLHADLTVWRKRAEQAEEQVAELSRQGQQAQQSLDYTRAELHQIQERVRSLEQELAGQRKRTEQAETRLATVTQRSQPLESQLTERTASLRQAQARVRGLERDLSNWRSRAENAEVELVAIERAREDAEAKKQTEAEDAHRRAEEARRQQPAIWPKIGIALVRIPAGEFFYGDDKQKVFLPEYWIAKTPVTNAQYAVFVRETGHPSPSHWNRGWIPFGKKNHPVVNVSWEDALKFCQWAGLRLPTEEEWEKAARGTDGREYPWGNQGPNDLAAGERLLCNFRWNYYFTGTWVDNPKYQTSLDVEDTTPVGRYPAGTSPYGLLDTAGNVWEWCEDWYDTDHKMRVLRGGSWRSNAQNVRVTVCLHCSPDQSGAAEPDCGNRPVVRDNIHYRYASDYHSQLLDVPLPLRDTVRYHRTSDNFGFRTACLALDEVSRNYILNQRV